MVLDARIYIYTYIWCTYNNQTIFVISRTNFVPKIILKNAHEPWCLQTPLLKKHQRAR